MEEKMSDPITIIAILAGIVSALVVLIGQNVIHYLKRKGKRTITLELKEDDGAISEVKIEEGKVEDLYRLLKEIQKTSNDAKIKKEDAEDLSKRLKTIQNEEEEDDHD
jgi:uncharacterized protein YicC (UPF0701 family)